MNHGQLQVATSQLSEMMQDLLQKMCLQDKDWQKALEKLFVDMDCKVTPPCPAPSWGTLAATEQTPPVEKEGPLSHPCCPTAGPLGPGSREPAAGGGVEVHQEVPE